MKVYIVAFNFFDHLGMEIDSVHLTEESARAKVWKLNEEDVNYLAFYKVFEVVNGTNENQIL